MSENLKLTATQIQDIYSKPLDHFDVALYMKSVAHDSYSQRSIKGTHFNSDDWHERIERACRGRKNFQTREELHRSVATVFAYFETMQNPAYMDAFTLLQAYEALLALLPHAGRYEDSLLMDHARACRMEMVYRLKGQIPAEMGKSYLNRTQDDYDVFQFI